MTGARTPARARLDRGQATIELALALPVVVVVVLGLTQIGVAIRNELAVALAAREGARAASVSSSRGAAASAARRAVDLPIDVRTETYRTTGGAIVAVTVTYVDSTDVPIIGVFLGPITHRATVSMAVEPP